MANHFSFGGARTKHSWQMLAKPEQYLFFAPDKAMTILYLRCSDGISCYWPQCPWVAAISL
jgi:hypothetical protein